MLIRVENLVKRYKDLIALDHLNLEVKEGEILGLLGPNGSGKTTAINCILSLLKYDKGYIEIFGQEMKSDAYDIKRQIGVVFQNVAVFDELSVEENIQFFCGLYIKDKQLCKKYTEEALQFVELESFRKFRPKKLSGGLLRRLNIACGIAHKPKLLFMDEPTVAVDPQSRNVILERIKQLNAMGTTIIYTSHYMEEVEQICSRIIILDNGRVVAQGSKEELKDMISLKEKILIEGVLLNEEQLETIKKIQGLIHLEYHHQNLELHFDKGEDHLVNLLKMIQNERIGYGQIYTQKPTLNDVFLEITGKELRDVS